MNIIEKIFKKLLNFAQKPLIKNILIVISITVIIKGVGFYKETLVASEFGSSKLIDTFLIAMLIPGFIQTVFLNSFTNVFIPNYVAEQKTKNNISSFQSSSFLVTFFTSILFFLIAYFFTDFYLEAFFPGHEAAYYQLIKTQFRFIAPCLLIWGISSLLTGLLNINSEFKYSSFSPIFIPLCIIIFLLFYKSYFKENTLAASTLIGSTASLIFLLIVSLKKGIIHLGKPNFKNSNFRIMIKQVPLKISSSLLTGLVPVVDQYFAAKLIVGSIAAINYGLKIPAFILGFSMIGLGNVLLPHFSKIITTDIKKAYEQLFKILKYLFIGSLAFIAIVIFFSTPIVRFLFERNEFKATDTVIVSNIQKILLAYVPFYLCGNVLVKFLTGLNKNKFMANVSLINLVLNIILDYFLMKKFGVYGIVLCTSIIYSISPFVYLIYTKKQFKKLGV